MKLAILLLLALGSPLARAENFTADVYDEDKKTLLYKFILTETVQGKNLLRDAVYNTPDGKLAFKDRLDVEDGRIKSYSYEQPDAHISAKVEASGKKLLFSYTDNGKTKTDDDDFKDNTVLPANTTDFIRAHWDEIAQGKDADARVAAMERCETVGFEFNRTGEGNYEGKDAMMVRMKPTSFIIAAIVKTMNFVFDKTTHRTLQFRGRLLPKKIENGKLKDQDGVFVYHYQ